MVSPMVVNTARNLCWRKASMLWLRLSARLSMSGYDPLPFFSYANDAGSGERVRQGGDPLTVDLHRSGFDFALRIGTRIGQAGRDQNLSEVRAGIGRK